MQTLWILADQLSPGNAALAGADPAHSVVLFVESKARGELVRYHQQKLVLVYSGMRHFARDLRAAGWRVDYHHLEDTPDFLTGLRRHVERHQSAEILLAAPNDYAMTAALPKFARRLGVPVRPVPTRQFLLAREEFAAWAGERPHLVMEEHYRRMRRRTGWLMEPSADPHSARPAGGAWNFDPLNRLTYKQYAASGRTQPTVPVRETPDEITREVISLVEQHFPGHPGRARDFWFPVDRAGALRWLDRFVTERLEHFGPFEDVLAQDHPVLYHSVLSPLLNLGLLHPRECVERAVAAYEAGHAPIHSVEGFVRQVIGWREFINGAYWHAMPGYKEVNHLQASRPLSRTSRRSNPSAWTSSHRRVTGIPRALERSSSWLATIAAMGEVAVGVVGADPREPFTKGPAQRADRPCGDFTQVSFELAPGRFDRVEVGRVGRQVDQSRSGRFDLRLHALDLVGTQVVHDHDGPSAELGDKHLFQVGQEHRPVGGSSDVHTGHGAA